MAKKEKTKLTKEERLKQKAETQVPKRKDAFYLLLGLFALALSAYTFFSLLSYVFTWAEDQSLFHNKDMFNPAVMVENNGGKLGLIWANFLISRLFGLGAFIVPFFFLGVGLYCLRLKKLKLLRLFILSILGCIVVSLVCSYIFSFTKVDDWFSGGAGGSYGYFVIQWLNNMIGAFGSGCIVFMLLAVWMVLVNGRIITSFFNWIDRITAPKPKEMHEIQEETADGKISGAADNLFAELDAEVPATCEEEDEETLAPAFEIIGGEVEEQENDLPDNNEEAVEPQEEQQVEVLSVPAVQPVTQEEAEEDQEYDQMEPFDPRLDLSSYQAPPLTLLED